MKVRFLPFRLVKPPELYLSNCWRHSSVVMSKPSWQDLSIDAGQLRPEFTLTIGQCFNWKKLPYVSESVYLGVVDDVVHMVKQTENSTECLQLKQKDNAHKTIMPFGEDYFQLSQDLNHLYTEWGSSCFRMQVVTTLLKGVRVVRQDPWECLISFICSSNNNIARITQMLDKLRRRYGVYLCTLQLAKYGGNELPADALPLNYCESGPDTGEIPTGNSNYYWRVAHQQVTASKIIEDGDIIYSQDLYTFPTEEALAGATEEELRGLGMGYRAKFIVGSAKLVQQKNASYCAAAKEETGVLTEATLITEGNSISHGRGGAAWFEELRSIAAAARQPSVKAEFPISTNGTSVKSESMSLNRNSGDTDKDMRQRINDARLRVQQELLQLPGVGRKVADCVALFSLDQSSAVPVDTHVWNIAIRDYAPELRKSHAQGTPSKDTNSNAITKSPNKRKFSTPVLDPSVSETPIKAESEGAGIASLRFPVDMGLSSPEPVDSIETKSLTPAVYEAVGDVFRSRFGVYAGWAHSVLFAAELPSFRDKLPAHLQEQMKSFAVLQRSAKKAKRDEMKEKLEKQQVQQEQKQLQVQQ